MLFPAVWPIERNPRVLSDKGLIYRLPAPYLLVFCFQTRLSVDSTLDNGYRRLHNETHAENNGEANTWGRKHFRRFEWK
jgi:hypothetical protein